MIILFRVAEDFSKFKTHNLGSTPYTHTHTLPHSHVCLTSVYDTNDWLAIYIVYHDAERNFTLTGK